MVWLNDGDVNWSSTKKNQRLLGLDWNIWRIVWRRETVGRRCCAGCTTHRERNHTPGQGRTFTPQLPPTHVVKYWDFKYCSILKQTFALLKELWCRHPLLPFPCFAHGCQGWRKNFLVWLQNFNNSDNVNQRRRRVKHPKIQKEGVKVRAEELHLRNLPLLPQKNLNFFAFTVTVRVAKLQGKNWEALGKRWAMSL